MIKVFLHRKMFAAVLALLVWLTPTVVLAEPVTEAEAKVKAEAFAHERGLGWAAAGRMGLAARGRKARVRQDAGSSSNSDYYVFNIGSDEGFVIVSGDDRTAEILGYSDNGSISEDSMPDALRWLLAGYESQMEWLAENGGEESANGKRVAKRVTSVRTAIAPLIATRWNQSAPYNNYCPEITYTKDGKSVTERAVTGCVATAMAQVMAYHKWPEGTLPALPAYNTRNKKASVATLSETNFDWDVLTNTYTDAATGIAADAVAKLMQYCGSALKMNYNVNSAGGSSAFNATIADELKTNFGYDGSVTYCQREYFSYQQWVNMIYAELAASRPVVLGGSGVGGGHSFVCDGFQSDDYFHINWGWGGTSDGYFRLSVLNPREQGIGGSSTLDGFSYSQDAVVGIRPLTDGPGASCLALDKLQFDESGTIEKKIVERNVASDAFENIPLHFKVSDFCLNAPDYNTTMSFDYAVLLVDANNNVIKTLFENDGYSLSFNNGVSHTLTGLSTTAGITDGTYYIKVVSRKTGATAWQECYCGSQQQITAVVSGNTLTLTAPLVQGSKPSSGSITVPNDIVVGYDTPVTVSVTGGDITYHGTMFLYLNDVDEVSDDKRLMGKSVDIPAGQTVDVKFSFIPKEAGTKYLIVTIGGTKLASKEVTISSSDATDQLKLGFSATIDNLDGDGRLYGNALRATLTVTNPSAEKSYVGQLNCSLRKWTSTTNADNSVTWNWVGVGLTYYPLEVAKGETTTVAIARDDLEAGGIYSVRLTYRNTTDGGTIADAMHLGLNEQGVGSLQCSGGYRLGDATGATTIYPSSASALSVGDACFVDLRDMASLDGLTITTGTNPNCLYLLAEGATTPTTLSGCNVVKGTAATKITLTDDNDFFTPIAFTADAISYTRTFDVAAAGTSGWNTIFLPFDVESVAVADGTANGKTVDWFRSDSDTGKNFWLKTMTGDGDGTVYFDHAQSMDANTPYIIAVPDGRFGAKWQMTDKVVTFSGSNANIAATATGSMNGNSFKMCGSTVASRLTDIYALNTAGSSFVKNDSYDMSAFRAWFETVSISSLTRPSLAIVTAPITGIGDVEFEMEDGESACGDLDAWYTLSGARLAATPSARGLYIRGGKKVFIR